MCCSVNGSVCLVRRVFVICFLKPFAICLGVVVILLLNIMEVFIVCVEALYAVYGLPENVCVVPVTQVWI